MRAFLAKLLRDMYTGPDGETIALGRVYSLPTLIVGLAMLVHTGWGAQPPMSMTELGLGLAGIAAGVAGMVAATNHIDNPSSSAKEA